MEKYNKIFKAVYIAAENLKKAKFAIVRRVLHTERGNSNHLPKEKTKQKQKTKNRIKNKRKHRLITVIRIKPKLLTKQAMPERKASLKEQR